MPGDTIEGNFTVTNAVEACFIRYVYTFELSTALTEENATALNSAFTTAGYTMVTSGKKYQLANDEEGKVAIANGRTTPVTTSALGADITIPTSITDAAEDLTLTITLDVYAVQQDNYASSAWTQVGLVD